MAMITRSIPIAALIVALSLPLGAEEQAYDCAACRDTGKAVCPVCKAQEGLWCSECASRYACPFCGGIGWILCTTCGGKDAKAERTFDWARKVEVIHEGLYKSALEALQAGKAGDTGYYVCQVCGNTVENEAPEKCPVCGAPKSQFLKTE